MRARVRLLMIFAASIFAIAANAFNPSVEPERRQAA
jgi:hypothetical protein